MSQGIACQCSARPSRPTPLVMARRSPVVVRRADPVRVRRQVARGRAPVDAPPGFHPARERPLGEKSGKGVGRRVAEAAGRDRGQVLAPLDERAGRACQRRRELGRAEEEPAGRLLRAQERERWPGPERAPRGDRRDGARQAEAASPPDAGMSSERDRRRRRGRGSACPSRALHAARRRASVATSGRSCVRAALAPQNATAVSAPKSASKLAADTFPEGNGLGRRAPRSASAEATVRYAAIARASPGLSRENQGHGMAIGSSRPPSGRTPRVTAVTIASSLQPPRPVARPASGCGCTRCPTATRSRACRPRGNTACHRRRSPR